MIPPNCFAHPHLHVCHRDHVVVVVVVVAVVIAFVMASSLAFPTGSSPAGFAIEA
jgi:Zn-dependent protease with chaperone function